LGPDRRSFTVDMLCLVTYIFGIPSAVAGAINDYFWLFLP
jgi:hypothetical protein